MRPKIEKLMKNERKKHRRICTHPHVAQKNTKFLKNSNTAKEKGVINLIIIIINRRKEKIKIILEK